MVIDAADAAQGAALESEGVRALTSSIFMNDLEDERRLAKLVLEA
jgi:hypothetical protein